MKTPRFIITGAALLIFVLASALLLAGCGQKSGTPAAPGASKAPSAQRDYILIGRPNPTTGPLAGFG
ncbi:MAG: lipoprotein, partial [Bacillota bacterium]